MKQVLLFSIAVLAISSCKKNDNTRPYSTWYINGEKFSSNNSTYYSNLKNAASLSCSEDAENGFYFMFVGGGERMSSNYMITQSSCSFHFHGKDFLAPHDTFFYIHRITGSKLFTIDTERIYRYDLSGAFKKLDSAIVWGTFSFP